MSKPMGTLFLRFVIGYQGLVLITIAGFYVLLGSGCTGERHVVMRACEEGAERELTCEDGIHVKSQRCENTAWVTTSDACTAHKACIDGRSETVLCDAPDHARVRTCEGGAWVESPCAALTDALPIDVHECEDEQSLTVLCEDGLLQTHQCADHRWNPPLTCARTCAYDDRQELPCGVNARGKKIRRCVDHTWEDTWLCLDPDECVDDDEVAEASCGDWVGNWSGICEDGQWTRSPCQHVSLTGAGFMPSAPRNGFCALGTEGTPYCWGANDRGQLGRGHTDPDAHIEALETELTFRDIAYGPHHSCAITRDNKVHCWGGNHYKIVVDDDLSEILVPIEHTNSPPAHKVVVGPHNACILDDEHQVHCWGDNHRGQLTSPSQFVTHTMFHLSTLGTVRDVSIGHNTICAVANGGRVWCWGDNFHSLILSEQNDVATLPIRIDELSAIQQVAVSPSHICAMDIHRVFCWGDNRYGQLGGGNEATSYVPIEVSLPSPPTKIVVGTALTCALTADHSVYCWGSNHAKEIVLSEGALPHYSQPTHVAHMPYAADLAISSSHDEPPLHTLCGATQGGKVMCWGHTADLAIPEWEAVEPPDAPVVVAPH